VLRRSVVEPEVDCSPAGTPTDGRYQKAKASIDAAIASSEAGIRRAGEAMNRLADLERG
jgi:hypothetical protein